MTPFLDHHDDELGLVRLCRCCGETWPKDGEFWYFDRAGKIMGHCRACWSERNRDQWGKRKYAAMVAS